MFLSRLFWFWGWFCSWMAIVAKSPVSSLARSGSISSLEWPLFESVDWVFRWVILSKSSSALWLEAVAISPAGVRLGGFRWPIGCWLFRLGGSFSLVSSWLSLFESLWNNGNGDWPEMPKGLFVGSNAGNDSLRKLSENRSCVVMLWLNGLGLSYSSLLIVLSFLVWDSFGETREKSV